MVCLKRHLLACLLLVWRPGWGRLSVLGRNSSLQGGCTDGLLRHVACSCGCLGCGKIRAQHACHAVRSCFVLRSVPFRPAAKPSCYSCASNSLSAQSSDGAVSLDVSLRSNCLSVGFAGWFPLRASRRRRGFVLVPALGRYSDLSMRSVTATSLAVIGLVSVSGVSSSVLAGNLDWTVALPFSAGAIAGMLTGQSISARLDGKRLQKGFGLIAFIAAVALMIESIRY